jgi:YidC/Oxa1 family membrane protein insertase
MIDIWNNGLYYPLLNALVFFYKITGNFGWSIVVLTSLLRVLTTPLVFSSLKASKKMQDLAPDIAKLKDKHKDDKQALMTAQSELFKEHGLSPAAGCLPQILQIVVLIALFNAFNVVLSTPASEIVSKVNPLLYSVNKLAEGTVLSTQFFSWNLIKPDVYSLPGLPLPIPGFLLLASALIQFLSSKMMMPENKTKVDPNDAMAASQEQMVYMFPLMTILFGAQFPSGLVLYWFVFSLLSMIQQYFVSGWGGLSPWLKRLGMLK